MDKDLCIKEYDLLGFLYIFPSCPPGRTYQFTLSGTQWWRELSFLGFSDGSGALRGHCLLQHEHTESHPTSRPLPLVFNLLMVNYVNVLPPFSQPQS